MKTVEHEVDICVVGGGMAGVCASLAAARHGASVVLMHDRPVLGGNASSEIRVQISGAWGSWDRSIRETGIIEEIMLDILHNNPTGNWSLWDLALFNKVNFQPGLKLLLNCSCTSGSCEEKKIRQVSGWQSNTQTTHTVKAKYFIDCSGDSILAEISGAQTRSGREPRSLYGEPDAAVECPPHVMGSSLIFAWRDRGRPVKFTPPSWAYRYETEDEAPHHPENASQFSQDHFKNCFYAEYGGYIDTVGDDEAIRDELLKIGLGIVDHLKNHGDHGMENLELDWFGFLPGKRESKRYVGDYTLTENDIDHSTTFEDIIAYGGWPVDDHDSAGSLTKGRASHTFHRFEAPYPIPYRCLYSAGIDNLFCAGRNISTSHLGLCTIRVIATCGLLGQAAGTAAAIAARENCTPRQVGQNHIQTLQTQLMEDDCWLPGKRRTIPELAQVATLDSSNKNETGNAPALLLNGKDRPCEELNEDNAWTARSGDWAELRWQEPRQLSESRIVFDSNLLRHFLNMPLGEQLGGWNLTPPETLVQAFRIQALEENGAWQDVFTETDNFQRLVTVALNVQTKALRLQIDKTWGADFCRIFGFDVR